ncbi:carboxylating nicotinate-nucleotide diphosphorylase [Burkholderia vietnamiensis]|jgi:nicotinate-nucleotide pyrophosphorylase (carboxylating)|nr:MULTISPECIES: carboxylating nicotinate-nucleotide diphosphorylase [Burkholderia]AAD03555.1 phthalate-inducible quinolinate phosphoribosyl transferase [Burkholderia cepacia]ABO57250.1 nicotinate-nucleotide pyrophosphorylase (carboxylating) [Burkholderia vietnamiensis G4]ABX18479.1 nicotinate-nucleotide pyrophosphorylase [Burkholderia multivorans ATCC 17616]AMU14338.1 nicotinate-nucleotide diphosphorylase (carboxylating) [Burkholderia cenocepacia]AOK64516.1 nicotinate-nucleotide pyrophosphory
MDGMTRAAMTRNVRDALAEDIGEADWTSLLIDPDASAEAVLTVREPALLCGRPWFDETFQQVDPRITIEWLVGEGERMHEGQAVCRIAGLARGMLTAERTALNFIQLLSGVATETSLMTQIVEGTSARILDTRKTLPGLRLAQKYAVRVGGGENHRRGLYDGILIKENHIAAGGGIASTLRATEALGAGVPVQVEVETLDELKEALAGGAAAILLDNFSIEAMREAVRVTAGRAELEVSGGVTEQTLRTIAETGVDRISLGKLTKNVRAIDFSLRFAEFAG